MSVCVCFKETRGWRPEHRASRAEEVCSDTSAATLGWAWMIQKMLIFVLSPSVFPQAHLVVSALIPSAVSCGSRAVIILIFQMSQGDWRSGPLRAGVPGTLTEATSGP